MNSQNISLEGRVNLVQIDNDSVIQLNIYDSKLILSDLLKYEFMDSLILKYEEKEIVYNDMISLYKTNIKLYEEKEKNYDFMFKNYDKIIENKDKEIDYLNKEIKKKSLTSKLTLYSSIILGTTTAILLLK